MPHYFRTPRKIPMAQTFTAVQRFLKPFPLAGADGLSSGPTSKLGTLQGPGVTPAESNTTLLAASSLVGSAASILNEDMAAGVLAARDARAGSSTLPNTSTLAGLDFKQLLRDAHDFVDAIASVLPKLQGGAKDWLATPQSHTYKAGELTQLEPKAVRAGDIARISIKLHNDNADTARLAPHCTSLLGDSGNRITEERLVFTPTEIELNADESTSVTLDITVPVDCAKGRYAGIVKVAGATYLCAVVLIDVF